MKNTKLIALPGILAILTMACGLSIHLPINTDIKTIPTTTEYISINPPNTNDITDLNFSFGGGKLTLKPGTGKTLIQGSATYNVKDFKPIVIQNKGKIEIKQGNLEIKGVPDFDEKIKNEWLFSIGDAPINLTIKAGAHIGYYDFGGLNLNSLTIYDGASTVNLTFSSQNKGEINYFQYETGISDVSLNNLANANIKTMIFQSGGGNYKLDFSGNLINDFNVFIKSGLSSMTIIVPVNTHAIIEHEGGLTNISAFGNWNQKEDYYENGSGNPTIKIRIEMGAGNVILKNP